LIRQTTQRKRKLCKKAILVVLSDNISRSKWNMASCVWLYDDSEMKIANVWGELKVLGLK